VRIVGPLGSRTKNHLSSSPQAVAIPTAPLSCYTCMQSVTSYNGLGVALTSKFPEETTGLIQGDMDLLQRTELQARFSTQDVGLTHKGRCKHPSLRHILLFRYF
jgi:hypothetical protein